MGLYSVAKLYPPSTSTMKSESELVSNLERMAVRSDNGRLQNSVGVHLRLKPAQDCGLMSSAFTVELVKPHCAFFGGMMISIVRFIRILFVDHGYVSEPRGCSTRDEQVLWA